MADESSSDIVVEKTNFISSLNPDSPAFEPISSSYQHIIETQERRNSTEDQNNHSHIEPIYQNGNDHLDDQANTSSTIHSVELTNNSPSKSHYIEETNALDRNGIEDPHIEPVTIEQPASEPEEEEEDTSEVPFEQSSSFLHEPESTIENEISTIEQQPMFDFQTTENNKPAELKAQRELDDEEIPPVIEDILEEVQSIQTPQSAFDDQGESRRLTALETPFEHHDSHKSINESPSSLPDVVTQTLEQDRSDFLPQFHHLEQPRFDEIQSDVNEEKTIEDIFPPLPPSSLAREQTLDSQSTIVPPQQDDILGNKSLLKQTLVSGIRDTRPTRCSMATISYTLFLVEDSSPPRPIETVSNETFFVGESDILPAIDLSVQLMDRGERALIDADVRHCYGELGCEEKQIPSTSRGAYRMKIELELHDWQIAPDVQTLSIDERLKWGDRKRHMGNFSYRRQDYSGALTCYRGALRFLDTDDNPISTDSDPSVLNERYIQVQNNVGQVNLLLSKYDACLDAVQSVLKRDPRNVKALFRQGKALFELGKYDEARVPLKLFIQLETGHAASGSDKGKVTEMLNICESKLAGYQKGEKEMYRRMFQPTTTAASSTTLTNKTHSKVNKMTESNTNNNWWAYVTLGTAALAAVGIAAFIKYRKTT